MLRPTRVAMLYGIRFAEYIRRERHKLWPAIKRQSKKVYDLSAERFRQLQQNPKYSEKLKKLEQKFEPHRLKYEELHRPKLLHIKKQLEYQFEEIKFYRPLLEKKAALYIKSRLFGRYAELPTPSPKAAKWGRFYYFHPSYLRQFHINHGLIMYIKRLPFFQKFFYMVPLYFISLNKDWVDDVELYVAPPWDPGMAYDFTGWGNWSIDDFTDWIPDIVPQGFKRG